MFDCISQKCSCRSDIALRRARGQAGLASFPLSCFSLVEAQNALVSGHDLSFSISVSNHDFERHLTVSVVDILTPYVMVMLVLRGAQQEHRLAEPFCISCIDLCLLLMTVNEFLIVI